MGSFAGLGRTAGGLLAAGFVVHTIGSTLKRSKRSWKQPHPINGKNWKIRSPKPSIKWPSFKPRGIKKI